MKNLTKPLGAASAGRSRQIEDSTTSMMGDTLRRLPVLSLCAAIIGGIILLAMAWIAVVDDPYGGEPVVHVRIVEPKLDDAEQEVGTSDVKENEDLVSPQITSVQGSLAQLAALESKERNSPESRGSGQILIYDPSADTGRRSKLSLSTTADKSLLEPSPFGFLPTISPSGKKALTVYNRPNLVGGSGTARIALVIGGLGLNTKSTRRTINELPGEVTLAFAPYADGLADWMAAARTGGHEILLQVPLEPFDYPNNDPGPRTLMVNDEWKKNEEKLHWLMSRFTNYVGVINYLGARFSASTQALTSFFDELRSRGLMYVDDGSTPLSRARDVALKRKLPFAQSSMVLDAVLTPEDIDARLLELEALARDKGTVVGVATAFPLSIERISRWTKAAEKRGVTLIPISSTLNKSSF